MRSQTRSTVAVRLPVAAFVVMVGSGFAGLGYQIVWTQQAALWLGHEAAAVLAVVSAFFGGLALGALVLAGRVEASRWPARWYAGCEAAVALWGLALAGLTGPVSSWLLQATGPEPSPFAQWSLAFGSTFLLLLPATAAMGATLPAMQRFIAAMPGGGGGGGGGGRSIAWLYAGNTLGATFGVLATAFWLVPVLGLFRAALVCGGLNLACAVAALRLGGGRAIAAQRPPVGAAFGAGSSPSRGVGALSGAVSSSESVDAVGEPTSTPRRAMLMLALTGLLGIGYEVLVVRVLSQVSEDTVYTFALLLAVYLVGTALGAAVFERLVARGTGSDGIGTENVGAEHNGAERIGADRSDGRAVEGGMPTPGGRAGPTPDRLLVLLAVACLAGGVTLHLSEVVRDALRSLPGSGMTSALAVEATLAILSFGLPTFLMGMLFSALVDRARDAGLGLGRSLAVNTLGAAAAPLLFGAWLAPRFGPQHALVLVGAGYLVLISRRAWSRPPAALLALAMVVAAWWLPPLAFVDVPEGGRIVSYQEGALAAVSVVEDATGVSRLRIDNRQQEGSSASGLADGRQALLPLLFHPAPHRALFLGLGTGVTASAAAVDPGLAVDAVELLPEVIAASAQFIDTGPAGHALPEAALAHAADAKPNLRLVNADARRFVRSSEAFYDVIVADNFHPARSGSGSLYTVEHFQAVDARLAPGGIFCQWLPLHQLDLETLQSIVASFLAVHPDAWAVLATQSLETPVLGLMARRGGGRLDLSGLRARLAASAVRQQLVALGLDDDYAVPGSVVAGRKALTRFAAGAPLNTDDRPVVAYLAPRITYEPDSLPRDRLLVLVPRLGTEPGELLAEGAEPGWSARLAAYWSARDRFLLAGRDVRPSADVRTMLAQVREPLLAVLRISPEFRPAYEPLARMADALAPIDPAGARELRDRLEIVRQARDADRSAVPSVVRAP